MIHIKSKGDWKVTFAFLKKKRHEKIMAILRKYAEKGIEALREATPKDTGKTAAAWSYELGINGNGNYEIVFKNDRTTDNNKYIYVAVLIQYGHGTKGGGWVEGRDYINPALQDIFDQMAEDAWKEVSE